MWMFELTRASVLQMFHYSLATLQEKGLVKFLANYEEILSAELTVKGVAYMDQNSARFFAASGAYIIFAGKEIPKHTAAQRTRLSPFREMAHETRRRDACG